MKIGINTLWLKHKKVGGIETYFFNLLNGILRVDKINTYCLIVSEENRELFQMYNKNYNVSLIYCRIKSNKIIKRLLYENLYINKIAKENKVDIMFNPVYSKPLITTKNIPYVTTIHDLQALHYPEYFSRIKVIWLKFAWKIAIKSSRKVIAISDFVKEDIIDKYNICEDKICTIYNPVIVKYKEDMDEFLELSNRLNFKENDYFYTVSSMYKHKNLKVLLKMMKKIKDDNINLPKKLIISGIGGNFDYEFNKYIKKLEIEDMVIKTGYISDNERNILYKNCSIFLFPSIFEGFGMPPIEAMILGKKVITTKRTSIEEVTKGRAYYVNNPFNHEEWIDQVKNVIKYDEKKYEFKDYEIEEVAKKYIKVFNEVVNNKHERG